jgi:hypothetical protein
VVVQARAGLGVFAREQVEAVLLAQEVLQLALELLGIQGELAVRREVHVALLLLVLAVVVCGCVC